VATAGASKSADVTAPVRGSRPWVSSDFVCRGEPDAGKPALPVSRWVAVIEKPPLQVVENTMELFRVSSVREPRFEGGEWVSGRNRSGSVNAPHKQSGRWGAGGG
jgi:hypothetical protein